VAQFFVVVVFVRASEANFCSLVCLLRTRDFVVFGCSRSESVKLPTRIGVLCGLTNGALTLLDRSILGLLRITSWESSGNIEKKKVGSLEFFGVDLFGSDGSITFQN